MDQAENVMRPRVFRTGGHRQDRERFGLSVTLLLVQ